MIKHADGGERVDGAGGRGGQGSCITAVPNGMITK